MIIESSVIIYDIRARVCIRFWGGIGSFSDQVRIAFSTSLIATPNRLSLDLSLAPMQTELTAEQLERESTPLLAANLQAPALTYQLFVSDSVFQTELRN